MAEEKDLQSKIAALSGRINLHRQNGSTSPYHDGSFKSRGHGRGQWLASRGTPYGYARGRARNAVVNHRNRTLVLNNSNGDLEESPSKNVAKAPGVRANPEKAEIPGTPTSWVSKRDRHMQLINTSIYDRVSQDRVRSMEATKDVKRRRQSAVEKARIQKHFQSVATDHNKLDNTKPTAREIEINCVRFRLADGGSKLIRLSDDRNTARSTPKRTNIAGIIFLRSKNGNLYRAGLVKNKKSSAVKKSDRLCPRFTSTGTCSNGPDCRFLHNPDKIAICKSYLQKGNCPLGEACDLSHDPTPNRVPACLHFVRGNCTNEQCRYAHVRVNPAAPVCRDFATLGYCEKGSTCAERHVFECPDYANRGTCRNSNCRLPHVDRAGQIRKAAAAATAGTDDASDISSDEDYDAIDSDDVDSDDLEDEVIPGSEDIESAEVLQQHDFIQF